MVYVVNWGLLTSDGTRYLQLKLLFMDPGCSMASASVGASVVAAAIAAAVGASVVSAAIAAVVGA